MSITTWETRGRRTYVACPYVQDAIFILEITPPGGPALQARARVIKTFKPFKACLVMRVALEEVVSPPGATLAQHGLPMDAVLKVYDHRFATSERNFWNLKTFDPAYEAEYLAYVNGPFAARTLAEISEEGNPKAMKYLNPNDDRHLLREHYLALTIASYFTSECNTYERLSSLQGREIPKFYGTIRFLGGEAAPNLDLTKPGILIEYIEGTPLIHAERGQPNLEFLVKECLGTVDMYSRLGVLNFGMRIESFIVKPDGSGVVMIGLENSGIRPTEMSDDEWMNEKVAYDEEGEFAGRARELWFLDFQYTYQWTKKD
ncbi:hypothetical protein RSOL_416160, partial [Rhizoctonia solani AG-3 Rhs1AP]